VSELREILALRTVCGVGRSQNFSLRGAWTSDLSVCSAVIRPFILPAQVRSQLPTEFQLIDIPYGQLAQVVRGCSTNSMCVCRSLMSPPQYGFVPPRASDDAQSWLTAQAGTSIMHLAVYIDFERLRTSQTRYFRALRAPLRAPLCPRLVATVLSLLLC
jgi:hypothetical protein